MEGSESEAIFESLNLKPQLFINEVLNSVDDLVDEAFTFFHQQASTMLKTDEADRSGDLSKDVACVRNMVQSALDRRLNMWENYCLRHCFIVPEGFLMPKADDSSARTLLDLDTFGDSELDAQLNSLRDKLTLVGKESADFKREIQMLERQSMSINHSAAAIDEVLRLCEKNSMNAMFQELVKTASEFQAKVDKMKARRLDEIEYGRAERMHISNGEIFQATRHIGEKECLFNAKLEELEELLDDMKTV